MRRNLGRLIWLTLVWVALWGDVSVANVLSGLTLGIALAVVLPAPRKPPRPERVRPIKALQFVGFFLWQMIKANAFVVYEVFTPMRRTKEAVLAIPCPRVSDGLTTILLNTITLTPGTLVLEVRGDHMYVHVLHLESIELARRELYRHVRLAIDAFGSREVLQLFDDRIREEMA